ncbi:helix-turn-helix transcriptional regulator [Kribbella rubisoli]|uniref:helix-turn-helix transcriptional regulator n=1 Tax=Kribbella rubisoli TaxID=3075929 RepID=UPI00102B375B|nr:LuxR family transcriptional regulator [Kribbella rubisoli]
MSERELRGRAHELAVLDGMLEAARQGRSDALVLRGEAGTGKSALLDALTASVKSCMVARIVGIESEMELAYAGLYQLCRPFLDRMDRLAPPQHEALGIAFGQQDGPAPDRFLIGLAVLNLLSDAASEQPVLCVVDDAQWLDLMSARILAFVARRLDAESVVMVFAVRDGIDHELTGFNELEIRGLDDADARALLDSVLPGPVDPRVRDRIVAETRGNPLALLELPRTWTAAELADGLRSTTLASQIEDSFVRRVEALPAETRLLLLVAAAEPLGDATLLWRAVERLGLGADPAAAAIEAELITFGQQIAFRHPLVRSAAYRTATAQDRQAAHQALADVTDPEIDPDRRAWHRAQATVRPDEDVAAELERSANRAQGRGGFYSAAVFLQRSAELTPDPGRRAQRTLAAAVAKRSSGALDSALELLRAVTAGPPDPLRTAEVEHLRGEIAFDQGRPREAASGLLAAAKQLEPLDPDRARVAYLEAMSAAIWASGPSAPGIVAYAAAETPPVPASSDSPIDVLLEALALRYTRGYTAAAPHLVAALDRARAAEVGADDVGDWFWLTGNRGIGIVAVEVWDYEAALELATRQERTARATGALVQLQFALNFRANMLCATGELETVSRLVEEDAGIAAATGNASVGTGRLFLEAYRGNESTARKLIDTAIQRATDQGQGRIAAFATYTNAVLHNGLGRYDVAKDAALQVFEQDVLGYGALAASELAEAASRTGDTKLVESALAWLTERTTATPTAWGLGIEARVRALLSADESGYVESIEHLGRTSLRIELARSHLQYGEWLRREGRRVDARQQLRIAHEHLEQMGLEAFAERARHELLATGETVRKRRPDTLNDLTAQEAQIAGLARDGMTNPEIAAQLFISPRTVEWHLRKTFSKLGITSRRQLRGALAP